jgi:lysozyme
MPDVDGVYVLGYGNKIFGGKPVVKGQTTTPSAADQNCRVIATQCAAAVRAAVKVALKQGQLDACTDFVYNVGLGGFLSSTILRTINASQPVTADMFTRWNKEHKNGVVVINPGLTARRQAEYNIFIS